MIFNNTSGWIFFFSITVLTKIAIIKKKLTKVYTFLTET